MNEKATNLQIKLKEFFKKFTEKLKKVSKKIYVVAAAVLVLAVVIVVILYNRPYAVLVTGVTTEEASSILTFLESQGVTNYKVENNDTILVPESQEASLKARILMEGYPQSGFSYSSYYENVGSLSTESERSQAYLIALEEKMASVIRCFENVKDAVVDIAPGEDRSYVLDSGNVVEASASVLVTMSGTAKLTNDQATAIRRYVANAVQGLEIDSVSIADTVGNNYNTADSLVDSEASALKIQLEEEWENKIRTNVMQVLAPFYGEDNVRVSVNCVVDVSNRTVNSRDVYLPDYAVDGSTNGKGIIGSQIYEYFVTRPGDDAVGGLVGSETNSDIPEYVEEEADPDGTEQDLGGSGQVDYDNPYQETVALYTAGYLTDCTVSVSINSTTAGNVNVQNVRQHVARAAGIVGTVDEETGEEYLADKISVVNGPFYEEPVVFVDPNTLPVPMWVLIAAAGGLLLFIILLIIILVIRRKRRKKKQQQEELQRSQEVDAILAAAGIVQGAPTEGADVMNMQTEKSMELRKDIRQFAEENPEIAAQMVRSWLRGGEDNG